MFPLLFTLLGLLLAASAEAVTMTVTNTNDSGAGSLRQALANAQASAGVVDTIEFDASLNGQAIALASTLGTDDADGVTIDATALPDGIIIRGMATFQGFYNSGKLTLRGMTITGAGAPGGGGGGFQNTSTATLTLDRCTISGNTAAGGGGLWNDGLATVTRSTFSNNSALSRAAIENSDNGTMELTQCTVSGNTCTAAGGNHSIWNSGTMTLRHCTVAGNLAPTGSAAIRNEPGDTLTIENCILGGGNDGSTDLDNEGTLIRMGANLAEKAPVDTGSGSSSGPAVTVASPLLGSLADNGGPTPTMALLDGSPAIDAAADSTEFIDQRGALRPEDGDGVGGAVADLGAFESGNAFLADLSVSTGSLSPTFDPTVTTYSTDIGTGDNSLLVTPAIAQAGATITVNGSPVASGEGISIPLTMGSNAVTIIVTALDGMSIKTYTLTANRLPVLLVTSTADSGFGSLRHALSEAIANAGSDTITFDAALSGKTITLASALINPLGSDVSISASSLPSGIRIDGGGSTRLLVNHGNLGLYALTLSGSRSPQYTWLSTPLEDFAGCVAYNTGTFLMLQCTAMDNIPSSGDSYAYLFYNIGTMELRRCTVSNNFVLGGYLFLNGSPYGTNAGTGGILGIRNSTIYGNSCYTSLTNYDGDLYLVNSITAYNWIGRNSANSIFEIYNSGADAILYKYGRNYAQSDVSYFNGATNAGDGLIDAASPPMSPLGYHGGRTQTMICFWTDSASLNAYDVGSDDQRGLPVVDGDGNGSILPDVGAVEYQPSDQALLGNLKLSAASVDHAMAPFLNTTSGPCAAIVPSGVTVLDITPQAAVGAPTITVNGASVSSGGTTSVSLTEGVNAITIIVTAADGITTKTYTVNVTLLTSIETWRLTHFGSTADSGDSADLFDFDKDGHVNRVEFAFGLDPKAPNSGGLPSAQFSGGQFFFDFTQPAGVSGITYGAEWSSTMEDGDWHGIPDTGVAPQHLFSVPTESKDRLFLRFRID